MAAQAWPWQMPYRKSDDVEVGTAPPPLYPTMMENPSMRWSFIRKVYSIVAFQLLITVGVATAVVVVHPISRFFVSSPGGLAVYIVLLIVPFLTLCPLYFYHQRHPVNFFLLGIFTISLSFLIGLSCAFTHGMVVLEAVILTAVVVVTLTLYTFWAARRGYDFSFLAPFLLGSLMVLIVFGLIQAFFPLGRITTMVYGGLAALIFCGYIVYDTDNLIKRHSYDEYIWASVSLYLDIINLFLSLLTLLRAAES
ncbi:BI1-like protein [Nymphaea thermarum]|nr:BI1-like protein [Nymphaea thermarum]